MAKNTDIIKTLISLFPEKDTNFLLTAGLLATTEPEEVVQRKRKNGEELEVAPQTIKKARDLASNEEINSESMIERATEDKKHYPREAELKEFAAESSLERAQMLRDYVAWTEAGAPTQGSLYTNLEMSAKRYQQAVANYNDVNTLYLQDRHSMYYDALLKELKRINNYTIFYSDKSLEQVTETIVRMEVDEKAAPIKGDIAKKFAQSMVGNVSKNAEAAVRANIPPFNYEEYSLRVHNKPATREHTLIYWAYDAREDFDNRGESQVKSELGESSASFRESSANRTLETVINDENKPKAPVIQKPQRLTPRGIENLEKEIERQIKVLRDIDSGLSNNASRAFEETGLALSQNLTSIHKLINVFKENAKEGKSYAGLQSAKEALERNARALETAQTFKEQDSTKKIINLKVLSSIKEQSNLVSDSVQNAIKGKEPSEREPVPQEARKPSRLGRIKDTLKGLTSKKEVSISSPAGVTRSETVTLGKAHYKPNAREDINNAIAQAPKDEKITTLEQRKETKKTLTSMGKLVKVTKEAVANAESDQTSSLVPSQAIREDLKPAQKMLESITKLDKKLTDLEKGAKKLETEKSSLVDTKQGASAKKLQELDKKIKKIEEKIQKIAGKIYTTTQDRGQYIQAYTSYLDGQVLTALDSLKSAKDTGNFGYIAEGSAHAYFERKEQIYPELKAKKHSLDKVTTSRVTVESLGGTKHYVSQVEELQQDAVIVEGSKGATGEIISGENFGGKNQRTPEGQKLRQKLDEQYPNGVPPEVRESIRTSREIGSELPVKKVQDTGTEVSNDSKSPKVPNVKPKGEQQIQ